MEINPILRGRSDYWRHLEKCKRKFNHLFFVHCTQRANKKNKKKKIKNDFNRGWNGSSVFLFPSFTLSSTTSRLQTASKAMQKHHHHNHHHHQLSTESQFRAKRQEKYASALFRVSHLGHWTNLNFKMHLTYFVR